MVGKLELFGKVRDFSYSENSKELTVTIFNNNDSDILEIVFGDKQIDFSVLYGHDNISNYIFEFNRMWVNRDQTNDITGQVPKYNKTVLTFNIVSVFKYEEGHFKYNKNTLIIRDDIINYLFSPMRKIKVEKEEVKTNFDSLRTYKDLKEEDYIRIYNFKNNNNILSLKFGISSNVFNRYDKTYLDKYNSYIMLTFNEKPVSYLDIIRVTNYLKNIFQFLFRLEIDGFEYIEYNGDLIERDKTINSKGILNLFNNSNVGNLTKVVNFDKLDNSIPKILEYFFLDNNFPYYYDKTTNEYNVLKQFVMFSNFDVLTEKMVLNNTKLLELSKIAKHIVEIINEDESFDNYDIDIIERTKGKLLDIRSSYREKMIMVTKLYNYFTNLDIIEYTKKMTNYRNKLMHGKIEKSLIHYKDLRTFEKIIYIIMMNLIGLSNEDAIDSINALFLIH